MRLHAAFVVSALLLGASVTIGAQRRAADPVELAKQGETALDERRFGDALDAFTAASRLVPADASLCVGAGVAAYMMGQNRDAETWFTKALKLDPRYVTASEWLGEVQYREGRVDDAIATYEAALKRAPDNADMQKRLDAWQKEAQLQGGFYQSNGAHFTVLFEGAADDALARRVVERLEDEYWRIGAALNAYPERPITVVLYTDQQFRDITRSPNWAAATYDGKIRVPARGLVEQSADLGRVLAHEFVHAVVAMLGGRNVPVWLNEGLAVSFEPGGTDAAEKTLAAIDARPPLQQLQGTFDHLTPLQARAAYALSAHAVQRMIQLRGAPSIVMLLQDLQRGAPFAAAFNQRIGMRYDDFAAMIARD